MLLPFDLLLPIPGGPRIKQIPMMIKRIIIVPHKQAMRTMIIVGASCSFWSLDNVSIIVFEFVFLTWAK